MNRDEPAPQTPPETTEQRIEAIVRSYREFSSATAAAAEANDKMIGDLATQLIRCMPAVNPKDIGEVCIYLGHELTNVMYAFEAEGMPPGPQGALLLNLAALAGVRLYRAAELGADWITTGPPPGGG